MYLTSLLALNPDLSSLADALRMTSSSFAGSLGSIPVTILAPTNAAFEALPPSGAESEAIRNRNRTAVEVLLAYHVIQGTYTLASLTENPISVNTISNQLFTIAKTMGVNGQNVSLVFNGKSTTTNVVQAVSGRPAYWEARLLITCVKDIQTIPNVTVHKIDRVLTLPMNLVNGSANATVTPKVSGTGSTTASATAVSTGGAGKVGVGLGAMMGLGLALVL